MGIKIEPTTKVIKLDGEHSARRWSGETDGGIECDVLVVSVSATDHRETEALVDEVSEAECWADDDHSFEMRWAIERGDSAIDLIRAELEYQDERWGAGRKLSEGERLAILTEEVGEVAKAINDDEGVARVIEELVQVAACAVSWRRQIRPGSDWVRSTGSADLRARALIVDLSADFALVALAVAHDAQNSLDETLGHLASGCADSIRDLRDGAIGVSEDGARIYYGEKS